MHEKILDISEGMTSFKKALEEVKNNPPGQIKAGQKEAPRWNPYSFEGGSIAGICGDNFVVVASDTRMSLHESAILTRDCRKWHVLNKNVAVGGCMFHGDIQEQIRLLKAREMWYEFNFREEMTADLVAELLSRSLYSRRFFPYYAWNILAGIDNEGKGALYSYDPIGCLERVPYTTAGTGNVLLDSFFDNQVGWVSLAKENQTALTLERAQSLLKDSFRSAAERETCTGDKIYLMTMVAGKDPKEEYFALRED